MARLAIAADFLDDYAKYDTKLRNKVKQHATTFAQLDAADLGKLKGLHLEPYRNAADPRAKTIRIDDNHRGVVVDAGNNELFILMLIGTHDEVDRWMMNNTFKVNAATGALELSDARTVQAVRDAAPAPSAAPGLFEHRKDKDFVQLGVSEELVPALRAFHDEEQLLGIVAFLPQAQQDAILLLHGTDSVEDIYTEISGYASFADVDTDDLVAAIDAPASKSEFHVVADEDELLAMLSQPLAKWRVFLHPSQQGIVDHETYNGPARVTGGPGTGKTVVALHRARVLADRLDDRSGKPILFTTFTKNLSQAIANDLRSLGGSDLLDVCEVSTVDSVARRIVADAEGVSPGVVFGDEMDAMWQQIVDGHGLELSASFLANEWEQVILAQGCTSRSEYFNASRAGRGIGLDRRTRAKVWKAVEEFTAALASQQKRSFLQLAQAAAGYAANRPNKPYRHVVIDEAQDLHETQWRMLRAIVDEQPNDMFIVGDGHQRIYDRRSSLSRVGVNIRGRSKKLKINYRTTHEIMRWSMRLLGESESDGAFDDLDGETERHDFAGYHSYRNGPEPVVSGHPSRDEQLEALSAQVQSWIDDGVAEEAIGIAVRAKSSFDGIEQRLVANGVKVCRLPADLPNELGVRLGTMHRMKGLEFERVALADIDHRSVPESQAVTDRSDDPARHASDLRRELCLLYVAATRARDGLWVGWSGKPSRFLGAVTEA